MDAQCHACIGGTNVRTDIMKLEMGQHVVVGTPGRVFDMISRRALGEQDKSALSVGKGQIFVFPIFFMHTPHPHTTPAGHSKQMSVRLFMSLFNKSITNERK